MLRAITMTVTAVLAAGLLAGEAWAAGDPGRLLAPPRVCPGQGRATAPPARQLRAMVCLTNFARRRGGLASLRERRDLDRSAGLKSRDILRCDTFDHRACGRDFTYWMRRVGYVRSGCWRAAENIALAGGAHATPRAVFRGWLHSVGHRRNILGRFEHIGVGLRAGELEGRPGARVWTQHFGSRC
jgi:uncharacterized protein YkwD